jgi:hypothetical protein
MEVVSPMTNIQPPAPTPFMPEGFSGGQTSTNAQGGGPDFAAILAQASEKQTASAVDSVTNDNRPPVALVVAQVFNAYGFFPAGVRSAPPQHRKVWTPIGVSVSDLTLSDNASKAVASSNATATPQRPIQPQPVAVSGNGDPAPAVIPASPDHPEQVPTGAFIRRWVEGLDRRFAPGRSLRMEPLQSEWPHLAPTSSVERRQNRPGAADRLELPTADRPTHEPKPDRQERLVFRIEEDVVELVGRLQGLGDDEKQQLIEALDALLESYGLSLGSATLNGKPFARALAAGAQ